MGVAYSLAERCLDDAVAKLFASDIRIRSVGIGRHAGQYGYRAVRNANVPVPLGAALPALQQVLKVPVTYSDTFGEPQSLVRLPASGPRSPGASSVVPEQRRQRPLVCGLQLQNFDDDTRQGVLPQDILVGTLGCFVTTSNGKPALLSNNHVVAGENRGLRGSDQILQAGGVSVGADLVAILSDFIALATSPVGASPAQGNVNFNNVDAGIADLGAGVTFQQQYLVVRTLTDPATGARIPLTPPSGTATAAVGDRVFKVGLRTGLTFGEITDIATTVGPIRYSPGECWFHRCFTVVDPRGGHFSDHGDSGSAIINEKTGEVLGLLFAGNAVQTYACPIDTVLNLLNCTMV